MLKINFYPDSDTPELIKAAEEYQEIWNSEGQRILSIIEKVSRLVFKEKFINAIVFEGVSISRPLSLRASYDSDIKRSTLVHELCHRLLSIFGGKVSFKKKQSGKFHLQVHKDIDLILFEIWVELYGENFAKKAVQFESKLQPFYKKAWNWALAKTKEERREVFAQMVMDATIK